MSHKDIKIIVLSVVADKKIIDNVMNMGADYFLPKPFRVMELINTIKNF
jgi:DNA-binding NarL/FixJ family response regulator